MPLEASEYRSISEGLDLTNYLPSWWGQEARLALMLPYVSLVNDTTVRTRSGEIFQCIRLEGINSFTTEDDVLDKTARIFASIVAQSGTGFSYYVHKVSKAIRHGLSPMPGDNFVSSVNRRWQGALDGASLRDRTLTITVVRRPVGLKRLPLAQKLSVLVKEPRRPIFGHLGSVRWQGLGACASPP